MTTVYEDKDLLDVYNQRQKILGVFFAVTFVYLAFCIAWLVYHTTLPYAHPNADLPVTMASIATVLYVCFLFPFMGIKYSRVNRYFKVLKGFTDGIKNVERNYFYTFEEHSMQKDNIDVTYCVFESWNKKKQEWQDRIAYFDPEKPAPDFKSGDDIRYITQSNFIVQYEILQREAFHFEEMTLEEELGIKSEGQENTIEEEQLS